MSVHTSSLKGKRPTLEDKYNVILNIDNSNKMINDINFFSVYDGHGGKEISNFLGTHIHHFFITKKIKYPVRKTYAKSVFNFIQNKLKQDYPKQSSKAGSTCLIGIMFKEHNSLYLNLLNIGDCRCILSRNNMAIQLTKDHKPHLFDEHARIVSLGGEIMFDGYDYRIGDLSVSRSLGDIDNKYISWTPEMFLYKLISKDQFIVFACDGLWDVLTNQDVVNFVLDNCYDLKTKERKNLKINIAKKLGEFAISRGSSDNVTVIIVFLK